jgi:hypothetical protein
LKFRLPFTLFTANAAFFIGLFQKGKESWQASKLTQSKATRVLSLVNVINHQPIKQPSKAFTTFPSQTIPTVI